MKKFQLILSFICTFFSQPVHSSHLMGGEVLWECVKTGQNTGRFIFTVKLYRDCNGIPGPNSVTLTTNAPGWGGGIPCPKISQTDISPTGPGCPTCVAPAGYLNAVEEFVYRSAPINITGVPPAAGWFFYYTDCCRNGGITNLTSPGSRSFTLRAIMYPYNASNTNPCYDSSPKFAERPQLSTCTRNQTDYSHNAIDQELDSLVYDWDVPLDNSWPGTPIPYTAGYSSTSPLPAPVHNPANVAASLNSQTGVVSFTSFTPGAFVTVTKVTAYKCNVKVAEIFREIQIALLNNCIITNSPLTYNTPPVVQDLFGNPLNVIIDTVVAGDTVEIDLVALDLEALPVAAGGGPQSLSLSASGSQFGTNFTNASTGCFNPPCATLDPPLIDTIPPITSQYYPLTLQTKFKWITDCNHLPSNQGCFNLSSTYNFVIKVYDNFCPSPSFNLTTISIRVTPRPKCGPPRLKCLDVNDDGSTQLTFLPPIDLGANDTNKYFEAFYIYRSSAGPTGPYSLIDSLKGFSIANYDTVLSYTDPGANANTGPVHYYITTFSGVFCGDSAMTISDTLSTIYLTSTQASIYATLNWTSLHSPLLKSSLGNYSIESDSIQAGTLIWYPIGVTPNLNFNDLIPYCDSLYFKNYRIHVIDTSVANCISRSNISGTALVGTSASLDLITNDTTICTFQTLNLVANTDSGSTYLWNTGATSPTITASTSGSTPTSITYSVTVTNLAGCTASDSTTVNFILCSGMDETVGTPEFELIPNPAKDHVTLRFSDQFSGNIVLSLLDSNGKLILNQNIVSTNTTISLQGLSAGRYQALFFVNGKPSGKQGIVVR